MVRFDPGIRTNFSNFGVGSEPNPDKLGLEARQVGVESPDNLGASRLGHIHSPDKKIALFLVKVSFTILAPVNLQKCFVHTMPPLGQSINYYSVYSSGSGVGQFDLSLPTLCH